MYLREREQEWWEGAEGEADTEQGAAAAGLSPRTKLKADAYPTEGAPTEGCFEKEGLSNK